jgi:hypothetical protein
MVKTWVLVGLLLAFLIASGASPVSQSQAGSGAAHWTGEVTLVVRHTRGSDSVGEWTETYQLHVDWKEAHRIEVKNEQGELTGVLVILADHNSRWSGEVSGTTTEECQQRTAQGEGMGTETLERAWIYFSLSNDDPIQEVMPHGTYHVTGHSDESASGTSTYTNLCNSFTDTSARTFFGLKLMNMGREVWRPMPCTTPEACRSATFRSSVPWIPTEALKAKLEQELLQEQEEALGGRLDPQLRVVTDDGMRGHYSVPFFSSGDAFSSLDMTVDLTWDLERVVETIPILELTAEKWLPEGNVGDETTPVEITARLEGGERPEGKFRFTLYAVTREPGYALNAGDGNDTSPDFEFEAGQPGFTEPVPTGTSEAWEIETTELVAETTVAILARDYGAWAKLRCEVNVDGEWVDCRAEGGGDYITIPRDTDEDRIADSWEDEHGVRGQSAEDDEDAIPVGQNSNGDGISLYEEYRGFVNEYGEHQRLEPRKKELFVRDEHGFVAVSNFETASELTLIYIGDDGWTGPHPPGAKYDPSARVVNFNTSGHGHAFDQHALHVFNGQGNGHEPRTPRLLGYSDAVGFRNESPRTTKRTLLYLDSIETTLRVAFAELNRNRPTALQPEEVESFKEQYIGTITAHEMGHGVGLNHHGPKTDGDVHCFMRYFRNIRVLSGLAPFPHAFSKAADCRVGWENDDKESCWGQIQVSSRLP